MESTRLIALSTSGTNIGTFVSMTLSGLVAQHLNWCWIFYISGKVADQCQTSFIKIKTIKIIFRVFGSTVERLVDNIRQGGSIER